MLISPLNISPLYKKSTESAPPLVIANSFLLDGLNEYIAMPNADLASTLQGSGMGFTLITTFRTIDLSHDNTLYACWGGTNSMNMVVSTTGALSIVLKSAAATRSVTSTATLLINTWYRVVFVYDGTQSIGSKGEFYVEFTEGTGADNVDAVDASTGDYMIGRLQGGGSKYLDGYQNLFSVLNKALSPAEVASLDNGSGNFKDPQALFGANCVGKYNPDDSGSTAQFTMTDPVNLVTATTFNCEDADKVAVTPY